MPNEKAQQRDRLILEFGVLIQPFENLAKAPAPPSHAHYRIAMAKVHAGDNAWRQSVQQFARFAPDIEFADERNRIAHVPEWIRNAVRDALDSTNSVEPLNLQQRVAEIVETHTRRFFEYLNLIPIVWEPEVFAANTPFTSYLRVREAIAVVNQRLHYFDRYLHEDFFRLFLASVRPSVSIRLVTTRGNSDYGVQHVMAISNLARAEFKDYQLIQVDPADVHDRNLRVDFQNFTLGPGTARAGVALTNFGPADNSPAANQKFDDIINNGTVIHQS